VAEIECSVLVHGDPESVFDFVADSSQRSFWQRDVQRGSDPIPDLVPGSTWTEVRKLGSRLLRIHVTVTDACRPERFAVVGDAGQFRGHGVFEFRSEGSRTRVVYYARFRGTGLRALLTPIVARQARRTAQANLFRVAMRFAPPASMTQSEQKAS